MFGAIGEFISGIFKPAANLIDNLHTSDQEKLTLRNELAKIQGEALNKMTELEGKRIDAMSKVQTAEAGSKFWLTATWRPMCSMALVFIVVLASFGWIEKPDSDFYMLVQVFLGAYSSSRGLEKMAASIGKR